MLALASDVIDNKKFMGKEWSDNALHRLPLYRWRHGQ